MTFSDSRKALPATLASTAALLVALALAGPAQAQNNSAPRNGAARNNQDEARITLNFDNADLGQIVEAVQMATHKSIIVDPRVRAQVTMRSSTPVTPQAFWEIFQSILQVHNYIVVPGANGTYKVVPDANQRFYPGSQDLQDNISPMSDEVVTQVIAVKNVSAVQLVTVLRPLVPPTAQITHVANSRNVLPARRMKASRFERLAALGHRMRLSNAARNREEWVGKARPASLRSESIRACPPGGENVSTAPSPH